MVLTLSTIYAPNEEGLACNFVMHTDTIINIANFISPSCFANFRLGKIEGSTCETIVSSISHLYPKEENIHLFPNPTRDLLYLEFPYPNGKPYEIQIIDAMGKVVYNGSFDAEGGSLSLASLGLSSGLYVLQANRDGKGYGRRFLVN